ncbi:MAG: uroporphyrinogen-III C-methyltransferase [bacterium]
MKKKVNRGKVYLIGAGPGDPGLLTVKGADILSRADVVIYDRLIHRKLLDGCKEGCEKIFVGKQDRRHPVPQKQINELLVEKASKAGVLARLKGGDPFIFGRGGEEAEFLAENGIEFEVVPGVTSASAVPAYAGIPLTHRDFASSVGIVTGHRCVGKTDCIQNWGRIAGAFDTLVVLMGVRNMPNIVKSLLESGVPLDTPAAVIEWGTTEKQKMAKGILSNIVSLASGAGIQPPAVFIIGRVVGLSEKIDWFKP